MPEVAPPSEQAGRHTPRQRHNLSDKPVVTLHAPFPQPKIRVPRLALGAIVLLMGNPAAQDPTPNPLPAANNRLTYFTNRFRDRGQGRSWTSRLRHRSSPGALICINGSTQLITFSRRSPR